MASPTLPASLLDLLTNSIVLNHIAPYIPISSTLALTATCRRVRHILYNAPETFRYLDLSPVRSAFVPDVALDSGGINWRSQRIDEGLTQDEFCSGPLRGIFSTLQKREALRQVQTMILDGLSFSAELASEILCDERFNVRILSIREAPQLNHRKLCQSLEYAVRPTRPKGTPRLKGVYVFGSKSNGRSTNTVPPCRYWNIESGTGVMSSQGAQLGVDWNHRSQDSLRAALPQCEDRWYQCSGPVSGRIPNKEQWANTLKACQGLISFDAVLCRGPCHDLSSCAGEPLPPAIATVALGPTGCATCSTTPEGPARYGESPSWYLPLLDPAPLRDASVREAQKPQTLGRAPYPPFFARCPACLAGRFCERCFKFWDENCYPEQYLGMRTKEVSEEFDLESAPKCQRSDIKTHKGLCIESCLVGEMMQGAGSFGMWG